MTIEWEGLGGTRESQVRWKGKEEMDEYGEVGGESGGGSGREGLISSGLTISRRRSYD